MGPTNHEAHIRSFLRDRPAYLSKTSNTVMREYSNLSSKYCCGGHTSQDFISFLTSFTIKEARPGQDFTSHTVKLIMPKHAKTIKRLNVRLSRRRERQVCASTKGNCGKRMFVLISPPGALIQHQQGGWDQLSRLWVLSSTNDIYISDAQVHEEVRR